MKDLSIKLMAIIFIGLVESTLGLPVFFLSMAIRTQFAAGQWQVLWFLVSSLFLAFFWGFPWWQAFLILVVGQWLDQKIQTWWTNSWLRLVVLVLPGALIVALISGLDFSVRSVVYGLASTFLVLIAHKWWWVSKYQKKYL